MALFRRKLLIINIYEMRNFVPLVFALITFSCASQRNKPICDGGQEMVLLGTFNNISLSNARASAVAFEANDELGVYVTLSGQQLFAANNRLDNGCFKVASDGNIKGDPTVYYPDSKQAITLYAYYPFQATVNDANKLSFSVQVDQSTSENIKKSDLCHARQDVVPSIDAQKLPFKHMNSRIVVNLTNNTGEGLVSVRLLGVATTSTLNLGDGTTTTGAAATPVNITLDPAVATQAIVPHQTIAAGRQLLEVVLADGSRYTFTPEQNLAFAQSTQTTLQLSLNDNYTCTLSDAPQIEPWVTASTTAGIDLRVSNNFTAHWVLPHNQANKATRVVVSVRDTKSNQTKDYDCAVTVTSSQLPAACSYTFDLMPAAQDFLSYPYQIEKIAFYNATTLIQECKALLATNVYKQGAYTIGVNQDNILEIVTGAVTDWESMAVSGGISGGGVTNDFDVQMIEPTYDYSKVNRVLLTIDGAIYEWSTGVSVQSGHNKLLAKLSQVSLPAQGANKAPSIYPYVISRVELFNNNTAVHSAECYIPIGHGGLITLQLTQGGVVGISSGAIGGWVTQSESGAIDHTGSVTSNVFRVAFYDIQLKAKTVTKMVLTINGQAVAFTPYTMSGDVLKATSDQGIDIASTQATGSKPTLYPYNVSNVELYNGATSIVSVPISLKIPSSGDVTIKVVR